MAGYNYEAGMSNNAVSAYAYGKKPLSKITVEDIQDAGLDISKAFAIWLAKEGHWKSYEWHHSGGTYYNRVAFYDPEDLAEAVSEGDLDLAALKREYAQRRKTPTKDEGKPVEGEYAVFGGSRSWPRFLGHEKFTGRLVGNWIHLDGGGKKKANGRNIQWRYVR